MGRIEVSVEEVQADLDGRVEETIGDLRSQVRSIPLVGLDRAGSDACDRTRLSQRRVEGWRG